MQTFPLYRSYTPQRKLLPESCAELRNLIRISVTIKVCCLPLKKIPETAVNTQLPVHTDHSDRLVQQLHCGPEQLFRAVEEQCHETGELDTFT